MSRFWALASQVAGAAGTMASVALVVASQPPRYPRTLHCPPALEWRSPLNYYLPKTNKTNATIITSQAVSVINLLPMYFPWVHSIVEDMRLLASSCQRRPNNGSGGWW